MEKHTKAGCVSRNIELVQIADELLDTKFKYSEHYDLLCIQVSNGNRI